MHEALVTSPLTGRELSHQSTGFSASEAFTRHHDISSQNLHEEMSVDSLLKSLKAISASLKASKHSTKALAGAMVGLRGSPAHERLVNDGVSAVDSLKKAIVKITNAENIVNETLSSKTAIKTSSFTIECIASIGFSIGDRNFGQFI